MTTIYEDPKIGCAISTYAYNYSGPKSIQELNIMLRIVTSSTKAILQLKKEQIPYGST